MAIEESRKYLANIEDCESVQEFAESVDVVSYEIENVRVEGREADGGE